MYWRRSDDRLSRADFEAARLGFLGCLRRKRFSPQFVDRHAEELFGQACVEYSRKLSEGVEIENPPGWLIECAWRRTMSRLEAERSAPRVVSTEKSEPLPEKAAGPEDLLMDRERGRKVRQAIHELSVDQRRVLAVSYFEGLTVREAARKLRWHPSKAQRAHERARERLQELLGVERSEDLAIEIGLAAYLSVAAEPSTGTAQRISEGLATLKQQVFEGGATLKQQSVATYARAAEATPALAGMRPGTTLALLSTCAVTVVGGVTYCAEKGVSPIGAASGLIASTDGSETSPAEPPEPGPQAPIYTPVEPPPDEDSPPSEPSPLPAEKAPEPKPEPEKAPPVSDSYEPVHTDYMQASEEEPTETYEAPDEPAPVESSSQPAAVPAGAGPQFGGPGGP